MKAILQKSLLLILVCILIVGNFGCASVSAGHRIKPEMVSFITPGTTTRQEVLENLGPPLYDLKEGQLIAYVWEESKNIQWGGVYLFGRTLREPSSPKPKEFAYCIAFDVSGRVTRKATIWTTNDEKLEQAVLRWNSERQ